MKKANADACGDCIESAALGLPEGFGIRLKRKLDNSNGTTCPNTDPHAVWEFLFPPELGTNSAGSNAVIDRKASEVRITSDGYLNTLAGQPIINYNATYDANNPRAGYPKDFAQPSR